MDSLTPRATREQQLSELDQLHDEASEVRSYLVVEAIMRVRSAVIRGIVPIADDARIVQAFIGERTGQDQYGR